MKFQDIAIGQTFRFVWSGYVCVKISKRGYTLNGYKHTVGTITVPVELVTD